MSQVTNILVDQYPQPSGKKQNTQVQNSPQFVKNGYHFTRFYQIDLLILIVVNITFPLKPLMISVHPQDLVER